MQCLTYGTSPKFRDEPLKTPPFIQRCKMGGFTLSFLWMTNFKIHSDYAEEYSQTSVIRFVLDIAASAMSDI